MGIVIVGSERNVQGLTRRLLLARASKSAHDRAVQAIRDANPGLDLDRLRRGTAVVVPELDMARVSEPDAIEAGTGRVLQAVAAQLDGIAAGAPARAERAGAELAVAEEALTGARIRRLRQDPETRVVLDELRATAKADRAALENPDPRLSAAIARWHEQLAGLDRPTRGRRG